MSVFMLPLEKEFHWTRAQTSIVSTIGLALIAVFYVVAGYIQDRRGPRPVAFAGGCLFAVGFFLASYTTSLTWFYLTAGVIAGTGSGFGYGVFFTMTMIGACLLRNPAAGYAPAGWQPSMAKTAARPARTCTPRR